MSKSRPSLGDAAHSSAASSETRFDRETLDFTMDLDLERALEDSSARTRPKIEEDGSTADDDDELRRQKEITPILGAMTLAADDPENPRLWSTGFKVSCNLVLCSWVLALTYASTAYIASIGTLIARFGMSEEVAILGVTFFVAGFAAGPLIFGPSTELFGRRNVYIICGVGFSAFNWGTSEANGIPALLISRFLAGLFGSASIGIVPASIGDYTFASNRNNYMILYATLAFLGPVFGPLFSGFIQEDAGFRWNLRVMAIIATVTSIAVAFVPETHGPTLLKWKLEKEGHKPPKIPLSKFLSVYKTALSRPVLYLFTEPLVTLCCLYMSILYGILYGFFGVFRLVYVEIRGFSPQSFALTYIALGLGFIFGAILMSTVGEWSYRRHTRIAQENGLKNPPPEARLSLAYFGSILTPISLFIFAFTASDLRIHWAVPAFASLLFSMAMICIFNAIIPLLVDCYISTAASALAAGMASRALIGSVFPLFTPQMYDRLGVPGATALLAGITLLLMPIPFLFMIKGPEIRRRSQHCEAVNL